MMSEFLPGLDGHPPVQAGTRPRASAVPRSVLPWQASRRPFNHGSTWKGRATAGQISALRVLARSGSLWAAGSATRQRRDWFGLGFQTSEARAPGLIELGFPISDGAALGLMPEWLPPGGLRDPGDEKSRQAQQETSGPSRKLTTLRSPPNIPGSEARRLPAISLAP